VIKPGDTKKVRKEGMPVGSKDKGDLYIKFDVQFPKTKFLNKGTIENQLEIIQPNEKNSVTAKEEKIMEDTDGPIPETNQEQYQNSYSKRSKNTETQQCAQM